MYGDSVYGRQLLIARRLLERGVCFLQVWQQAGQPWDAHDSLEKNHRALAAECDQPIGALLRDLKQRGMLDSTLVIWGGEFGRTPTVEIPTPGVPRRGRAASTTITVSRCGSLVEVSRVATSTGPPMNSARTLSRIAFMFTTSTQRSYTCWASTMNASPISMQDAISA